MTHQTAERLQSATHVVLLALVLALLAGWASANAQAAAMPAKPVYFELPEMVANLDSAGEPRYLKLQVQLELKCTAPTCAPEINSISTVLQSIIDSLNDYLRGLKPEDVQGRAGLALLRKDVLSRVNALTAPAQTKNVLFKQVLVTEKP